jgi:glycine/D-amino acid oxidase-like deaminating enzyme
MDQFVHTDIVRRKVAYLPSFDDGNGWYNILPKPKPPRVLAGSQVAGWLVIGAGYAGLSAARRLAELHPQERIALIEADRVGRGTAGRNAGFAIDHPFLQEVNGDVERGARVLRLHQSGVAMLDLLVKTHKIDCQWSHRGKYQVAGGAKARRILDATVNLLEDLKQPFEVVGAATLARRLGTARYSEAIYTPGTCLMNPAALTRGLARSLPANVDLFENSPVIYLSRGMAIVAETPRGKITAPKAILATDGFTPAFGLLRNQIFNITSFVGLTEPLSKQQQDRLGDDRDWGVHPVGAAGATIRRTQDERIWYRADFIYASDLSYTKAQLERSGEKLVRNFHARFPQLSDVGFAHIYGGSLCISRNNEPYFARVGPNFYAVACQNGIGIAKGTIHGTLMAEWASGGESPLLNDVLAYGTPSNLPPEPLLKWGVTARLTAARLAGRQE